MKNILPIALSTLTVLASIQVNAHSSIAQLNIHSSLNNLPSKTSISSSIPSELIGTWKSGGTEQYIFFANGTFARVTSLRIYVGCGTAKAYVSMGTFKLTKDGINFQPTSARLRTWSSCTGQIFSESPAAYSSLYGAYATLQNNGQVLTLTEGGKATSYRKSAS
jgi:hypothetical protein